MNEQTSTAHACLRDRTGRPAAETATAADRCPCTDNAHRVFRRPKYGRKDQLGGQAWFQDSGGQAVAALLATVSVIAAAQASPPPLPNTMSPEATQFWKHSLPQISNLPRRRTRLISPPGAACRTTWPPTTRARTLRRRHCRKLGLSMIDAKLGGVPVIDVRPRGWDKADRRLIIYVHGGAFTINSARTARLPTPVALLQSPAYASSRSTTRLLLGPTGRSSRTKCSPSSMTF